ncbi:hypothetical protein Taro_033832, partial [Colocasia esculenta]|nr:hypothetical protein [Colocasia esculenta]
GFFPQCRVKQCKFIRWIPPIFDFSLNVDGACKGNPGDYGGGGCIRDKHGSVVIAFAHYYGYGSSLMAEARALCDGLRLADFFGLRLSMINSDSMALGQTFLAKVVSTQLLLVSTQCFKAKAECCRNGEVVSTLDQVSFRIVSRRALVCESSHSLCGLSRRAQFGVVVLQ